MGRPSVQKQRKAEVLDAFLTLVARYGVEGATLEKIAAESGLKRPLIRHHLGNRDDMVQALATHVVDLENAGLDELAAALTEYPGVSSFVDILFSPENAGDARVNAAFQSLISVVDQYPDLRKPLLDTMARFYHLAMTVLEAEYPEAADHDVRAVAVGVVDLYVSSDALAPLDPPAAWANASYDCAMRLARSLQT